MKDTRDLRDPVAMGEVDEQLKKQGIGPATVRADMIANLNVRNYPSHTSATDVTVPAYRKKMQELAAQGDVSAASVLLRNKWPLPDNMDPEVVARATQTKADDVDPGGM